MNLNKEYKILKSLKVISNRKIIKYLESKMIAKK